MHQPDDGEEDRRPRRIEQGVDAGAGEEGADEAEIAQRLRVGGAAVEGGAQAGGDQLGRQLAIEPLADAGEDLAAHHLQQAEDEDGDAGDDRQHHQRLDLAAGEDAIVHLHHVDGRGEYEQVDEQAERRQIDDGDARFPRGRAQRANRPGGHLALDPPPRRPAFPAAKPAVSPRSRATLRSVPSGRMSLSGNAGDEQAG